MKFSYTALSKSNRKLNGLLEAADLESAKEELHKMGLSIVTLKEISENEYLSEMAKQEAVKKAKGIKTFLFQATDSRGKPVNGTIDAIDLEGACERLIREYQFTVHTLYPQKGSEEEKKQSDAKLKELLKQYEEEIKKIAAAGEAEEDEEAIDKQVVAEIDQVILKTKEVLEGHAGVFSSDHQIEIRNTLAELERIRQSNNLRHIAEVCRKIYDLTRAPEKLDTESEDARGRFQEILKLMGQSALINKNSALYQKKLGLSRIRDWGRTILESIERLSGSGKKETIVGDKKKFLNKIKKWIEKTPASESAAEAIIEPGVPCLKEVLLRLKNYLLAKNSIIRETRKHELINTLQEYHEYRKQKKQLMAAQVQQKREALKAASSEIRKKGAIFIEEIGSFLGWLLAFYLVYLFLAAFSLEKNIGLPVNFVLKTLQTPIIINITIFLFISHLVFFIQKRTLKGRFIAGLFLFSFCFAAYLLLIFNL